MTLRVFHLVFVCCSAWLLSACCRSETYYVDQEVKDFTVFPVGSWWVYVDSVSGRRDSVVLESVGTFETVYPRGPNCKRAIVENTIISSLSTFQFDSNAFAYTYDSSRSKGNYLLNFPSFNAVSADEKQTLAGIFHRQRTSGIYGTHLIGTNSITVFDSVPANGMSSFRYLKLTSNSAEYYYEIIYRQYVGCEMEYLFNKSEGKLKRHIILFRHNLS